MLESARAVYQYVTDKKLLDLRQDRLLYSGVIRELLVIGEAANAVSSQLRLKISTIPWGRIIGMRNQLVHEYFEIDYNIIWSTVTQDIPELIGELEKVIRL